jgi:hypothetical protein
MNRKLQMELKTHRIGRSTACFAVSLLSLLALAGSLFAQFNDSIPTFASAPQTNVITTFGLVENSQSQAGNNRRNLQAALNAGPAVYPWFFPGATATGRAIQVDDTLVIPNDSGRAWLGGGADSPSGTGGGAVLGSHLTLRAQSFATLFDGSPGLECTTDGASATVTVVGRKVAERDRYNSLHVSGGTNFIPGWYGIAAANVATNQWTLDRICTTASGNAMTGAYCPAIVRNHGFGTDHRGLTFSFRVLNRDDVRGAVCYHVATHSIGGVATGKHVFESCSFGYAQAGILCGRDLAGAYGPTRDWAGSKDNHADSLRTDHCTFVSCANPILVRNEQSVFHDHTHLHAINVSDAVFRFDAGGKLTAESLEVAGWQGTQCLLKLGQRVTSNSGPYLIRGFSFDGGEHTRNPQLIVTDWGDRAARATVVIEGGILNRAQQNDNLPLVDVQGDCRLRLRDVQGSGSSPTGIWPKSIRLKRGNNGRGNYQPHLVIEGCTLDVQTDPEEVIDEAHCDPGITVEFFGNCKIGGAALANKTYTTTGP